MNNLLLQSGWNLIEERIGNERLSNILWFLGIVVATMLIKKPLAALIAKISCKITYRFGGQAYANKFSELTKRPLELLIQTMLFYIAVSQLSVLLGKFIVERKEGYNIFLNVRLGDIADLVFRFLLILFTTITASRVVDFIFFVQVEEAYENNEKEKQQLLPLVKELVKIVLWSLGMFWVLGSVFKVNIPALITGLGIGGVAIALAAKESVENFFAAFTILTDKPFQTGDAVKLGNLEGSVERIGFRSTRVRNADGSLYIIPNKKLIGENLENLSERDTRRVKTVLNLKYDIPHDSLQAMIAELKRMIQATLHVNEPVAVNMESFGETVFQLTLSYHLPHPMAEGRSVDAVKQEINMKVYAIATKYMHPGATPVVTSAPAPDIKDGEEEDENAGSADSII